MTTRLAPWGRGKWDGHFKKNHILPSSVTQKERKTLELICYHISRRPLTPSSDWSSGTLWGRPFFSTLSSLKTHTFNCIMQTGVSGACGMCWLGTRKALCCFSVSLERFHNQLTGAQSQISSVMEMWSMLIQKAHGRACEPHLWQTLTLLSAIRRHEKW